MPELPDVETIRRGLIPRVAGRCFGEIILNWPGMVKWPSPEEFCQRLAGQCIEGVGRRGKYLILRLSGGEALLFHLRMSGALLLNHPEPERHIRAIFRFDDGSELFFSDPRKLGVMWLVDDENIIVGRLGPEPLEPGFTPEVLGELLKGRSAPIKAVLLDQGAIAGIGNMYGDEALFVARIYPLKRAKYLSKDEVGRLYSAIRQVLESGIAHGGATVRDFRNPDGEPGEAQIFFNVAHRKGKPCPVCGTPIGRISVRNRGTYFCSRCQGGR